MIFVILHYYSEINTSPLKKFIVLLPVIIAGAVYLRLFYQEHYAFVSHRRVTGFLLSIALFYLWVLFFTFKKKQLTFFQVLVQSSFLVYVFAVLILTGYFILFREISSQGWWEGMIERVRTNDRVNLQPFRIFSIYTRYDLQVIGNLVMLFPLGVYLPILSPSLNRMSGFFVVLLISLMVSVLIEFLQLATRFRSADVDDVILNVTGACAGFLIYQLLRAIISPKDKNRMRPINKAVT